jgi:hypothetical protein
VAAFRQDSEPPIDEGRQIVQRQVRRPAEIDRLVDDLFSFEPAMTMGRRAP